MMAELTPPSNKKGPRDDAVGQHLKSWLGLLWVLGGLQLLCGGAAFICVCAAIPWGYSAYSTELLPGGGLGVPLTPFVLAVLGLAWLLTALLLGVTTRYHHILLGVTWWPPTEAGLYVLLFLLCLAAAGAHVHTVTLGGLCSSPLPGSPLLTELCRVDGAQAAALLFLFLTALLYLAGSAVALKVWYQGAAAIPCSPMDNLQPTGALSPPVSILKPPLVRAKRVIFEDEVGVAGRPLWGAGVTTSKESKCSGSVPPQPDYMMRYPAIRSSRQRQQYGAVFVDQHAEYRELRGRLKAERWGEDDDAVGKDLAFVAKQQRCLYLKEKLTHIKAQIQEYDRNSDRSSTVLF
ncbi:occludin/ELL domain-containing protein 1 [Coturnix japonica]|uniref:occludin/ELL domain-containing protein 1 n=1 Tax=Coturnix japonica TaxID=93934 RepID=UPI0007777495|nr:occludin/ELL domain-containing protein 1 [Coturnix japonica]